MCRSATRRRRSARVERPVGQNGRRILHAPRHAPRSVAVEGEVRHRFPLSRDVGDHLGGVKDAAIGGLVVEFEGGVGRVAHANMVTCIESR